MIKPVFIAFEGIDGSGKSTGQGDGDLEIIKEELKKFINQIN